MQAKYLFAGTAMLGLSLPGHTAYAGAGSPGGFTSLNTHATVQAAMPAAFLFGLHGLHGLHHGWGHGWHHYGPWSGGRHGYNWDHGGWGRYGSWQDGRWHRYNPWEYDGGGQYGAWGDGGWRRYYPYDEGWRRYGQWNYGRCCGEYPEPAPYPPYGDYGDYED